MPEVFALGSEPDDLIFRSGDLFALGAAFGAMEGEESTDGAGGGLPYGLRHSRAVRPHERAIPVDVRVLTLCDHRQIGLLEGEPLRAHAARTNGKTKIPYDTDTAPKAKQDHSDDVRDD